VKWLQSRNPTGRSLGDQAGSLACSPLLPAVNKLKQLAQKQLLLASAAVAAYNVTDLQLNRLPREVWSLLLWRYSRPTWTRSCAACCR